MLQQSLFFRELGFPLKKIKELLASSAFNRQEAFFTKYVADERFTKNFDKLGEGVAVFMRDAMATFARY